MLPRTPTTKAGPQPGQPMAARANRLRVLIVDDSALMRRLVTRAIEEVPEIEIVGTAANGSIALQRIPQLNPDVLTLDIEMPEMDGLETARQVRRLYPRLRIVMCSTLTQRGASVTLEALASGADDYVTKPVTEDSAGQSLLALRQQLVPKIRQFLRQAPSVPALRTASQHLQVKSSVANLAKVARPPISRKREILAVASSTGGPVALSKMVAALPPEFTAPIVIVQHMPPMFTRLLAERLNSQSHLQIAEAQEGAAIKSGSVLVAPGDYHMTLRRLHDQVVVGLNREAPENSCRPAADVLFRSVADHYGSSAVGVILTGMGHDGMLGLERMRAAGAWVIAQDEATSVVWGMPGAVVGAGLADTVLPLDEVAGEIGRQFRCR